MGLFEGKIRFVTAVGLNKCSKQIKYQRLLLTCAPIYELPYHIGVLVLTLIGLHLELERDPVQDSDPVLELFGSKWIFQIANILLCKK